MPLHKYSKKMYICGTKFQKKFQKNLKAMATFTLVIPYIKKDGLARVFILFTHNVDKLNIKTEIVITKNDISKSENIKIDSIKDEI